jgi:hypothetical protein
VFFQVPWHRHATWHRPQAFLTWLCVCGWNDVRHSSLFGLSPGPSIQLQVAPSMELLQWGKLQGPAIVNHRSALSRPVFTWGLQHGEFGASEGSWKSHRENGLVSSGPLTCFVLQLGF